jgi:hypothetical protein
MNKKLVNACILCLIIIVGCILINTFRGKNNINEGFSPSSVRDEQRPTSYYTELDETEKIDMSYTALDEAQVGAGTGQPPSPGVAPGTVVIPSWDDPLLASPTGDAAVDISNDESSLKLILQQFDYESLISPIGQLKSDVGTYKNNQLQLSNDIDKYFDNIDKNIKYYSTPIVYDKGKNICDKYIKPLKKANTYKTELNNLLSQINTLTNIVLPELNKFKVKKSDHITEIGQTSVGKTISHNINILYNDYVTYEDKIDRENIGRKTRIAEIITDLEAVILHINDWINLNLHSDRSDSKYTDVDDSTFDANYQPDEWCFNTEGVDNECLNDGKSYGCKIHCKNFEIVLGENGEQISKCSQDTTDNINYNFYTNVTEGQNPYKFHSHIHEHVISEGEDGELMPVNNDLSVAGAPL